MVLLVSGGDAIAANIPIYQIKMIPNTPIFCVIKTQGLLGFEREQTDKKRKGLRA